MSSKSNINKRDISSIDLIQVIKEKRIIWDRSSAKYKDRVQRDIAWKEVYKAFDPNFDSLSKTEKVGIGNLITKKWYNLRDTYAKSRKNTRLKRPYLYANMMSFLDRQYLDSNDSESEFINELKNVEDSNSVEEMEHESCQIKSQVFVEDDYTCETPNKKFKRESSSATGSPKRRRSTASPCALDISKRKVVTADLIKIVEGKRLLWDKTCLNYMDREKRDKAWKEVFRAIEPIYDELRESDQNEIGDYITKKWYNARDAYSKSRKGTKNKRPYLYGDMLKFLDPHFLDRNNSEIEYYNVNEFPNIEDSNSIEDSEDGSHIFRGKPLLEMNDDIFESITKNSKFKNSTARSSSLPEIIKKKVSTEELIEIVKKKRLLWDRACSSHKHREKRNKAWKDVYKSIIPNFDKLLKTTQSEIGIQIMKKWANIRDTYVKSLKNVRFKRPYVHSEMLTFLDAQYLNQNSLETEYNNTNEFQSAEEKDIEDESLHFHEEVFLDVDRDIFNTDKSVLESTSTTEESEQRKNRPDGEESLVSMLGNFIEREEDEERSFFKAILSSVKSLSEDSKLEFRISVLKLIQTLKKKDKEKCIIKQELPEMYSGE